VCWVGLVSLASHRGTRGEAGSAPFEYHSLADFDRWYTRVGPENYGWYQCRLHVAAKAVFEVGGVAALQRLWQAFAPTSDGQLTQVLGQVHPRLEQVYTGWPDNEGSGGR
jgi:hypothetical protein